MVKHDLYMNRCITYATSHDGKISSYGDVAKHYSSTNGIKYREALAKLIEGNIFLKTEDGLILTTYGKQAIQAQKEALIASSKAGVDLEGWSEESLKARGMAQEAEFNSKAQELGKNNKWLETAVKGSMGYFAMRNTIFLRLQAVGEEQTKEEIKKVFAEAAERKIIKPYKGEESSDYEPF